MEISCSNVASIDCSVDKIKEDVSIILTGYSEKKKANAVINLYDNLYYIQSIMNSLRKDMGGEKK